MAKSRNHLLNKAETISKYDGKVGDILKNIINSTVFFIDDGTPSYEGHNHDDRYYTKEFIDANIFTAGHIVLHFAPIVHTHTSTQITDFSEAVDDRISALFQNGTGLSWTYNDLLNTYTPTVTLAPFNTDQLLQGSTNLYVTALEKTHWNSAYSWGNHASAGYLLSSTASSTYLPLTGGTLSGNLTSPAFIKSGSDNYQLLLGGGGTTPILSLTWYDGWVTNPGYNANTIGDNKNGFTYANNAPYSGSLVHFGASGYGMQLNTPYNGGGVSLAFRTRNGDTATWNNWYRVWSDYDFSSASLSNWNTAYGWGNHASVGYLLSSTAASTYLPLTGGTLTGSLYGINHYVSDWYRNTASGKGLYNESNGNYFYSISPTRWVNATQSGANNGMFILKQGYEGTAKGYVYWDPDGFGLLNDSGGWSVRIFYGSSQGGILSGSWQSNGQFGAYNFWDNSVGTYNVNLGSGGNEGRGLVAGYSGGSYGGIGYNVRHTTTGGQWIAPGPDTSNYLMFNQGFTFYGAGTGSGGRTLTYNTLGSLTNAGDLSIWQSIIAGHQIVAGHRIVAGAVHGFFNANYASGFNNIWAFETAQGFGIAYKQGATGWYGGDTIRIDVSGALASISGAADFEVGANVAWVNGNIVWHAGNDGSTSGLDADLLDGYHASHFYPASNPNGYISSAPSYRVAYGEVSYRGGTNFSVSTSYANVLGADTSGPLDDFVLDSGGLKYSGGDTFVFAIECSISFANSSVSGTPNVNLCLAVNGTQISSSEQQIICTTEVHSVTCICLIPLDDNDVVTLQASVSAGSGNLVQKNFTLKAHKVN